MMIPGPGSGTVKVVRPREDWFNKKFWQHDRVPATDDPVNRYSKDEMLLSQGLFDGWCTCPNGQRFQVTFKGNCTTSIDNLSCMYGRIESCDRRAVAEENRQTRVICHPDPNASSGGEVARVPLWQPSDVRLEPAPLLPEPPPLLGLQGDHALEWMAGLLAASLLLVAARLVPKVWPCWKRPALVREIGPDRIDIERAMLGADALADCNQPQRDGSASSGPDVLADCNQPQRDGSASGGGSAARALQRPSAPSTKGAAPKDGDVFALGERQGRVVGFADRPNSEVSSSSFLETLPELTEGIFRDSKVAGIVKLGVYEHWVIDAGDIETSDRFGGKGSFGEVQHAVMYGGTDVALKTAIHLDEDDQQGVSALANEVRLLRRIRHSNIVMFHGVTLDSDVRGIAMVLEWVEGDNLDRYIKPRTRPLVVDGGVEREKTCPSETPAVQSSCKLLEDVSRGMQYLHAQSPVILHRDLKPANILVEMITEPPRAKIADFGLSVLVKGVGQVGRAGTLAYMAPEVRRGELYSTGADVYSFGGVALFVLTGRNPDSHLVALALEGRATSAGVFDWSQQPRAKAAISQVSRLCFGERLEERPDFSTVKTILASAVRGTAAFATAAPRSKMPPP